jgi:ABC-type amino acid transport substrate-binding protein
MKNKTVRWMIAGGLVLLLVVAGLSLARGRGDDGALERVQSGRVLRVGLDASFPPFETLDTAGEVSGVDADLAHALAAKLGAEPAFVNLGFDGLYDALLADKVDVVISGLPYDPRRTRDVIYSPPYFNAGQVLVARTGDVVLDGSQALAGRTVAVEWGSQADMEARRLKQTVAGLTILSRPTAQDALQALATGQADAAIADGISARQFMRSNASLVRVVETLTDEPYVVASRARSRRLAEAIDRALLELRESGELDRLLARWF